MNISSIKSDFSVEEDSGNHEDSSEERAPESGVTTRDDCRSCSCGNSGYHGGSESGVDWGQRGSLTHPFVRL